MAGYTAISFVTLEMCVQAYEGKVGRHSVHQVEEGYEGFVVMLVLRLLLLTLGYSQSQTLHDERIALVGDENKVFLFLVQVDRRLC